jgi:hypothetical protein
MIGPENRFSRFGIMLQRPGRIPGAVKLHLAAKSSLRLKPYPGLWISRDRD